MRKGQATTKKFVEYYILKRPISMLVSILWILNSFFIAYSPLLITNETRMILILICAIGYQVSCIWWFRK